MDWRFVELCCGSAALTLHLLGARRALLPYQGSKWRFRVALTGHLRDLGFEGRPRAVELFDPGPWGVVAPAVIEPAHRAGVVDRLENLARLDPRVVFDGLHKQPVPADPLEFAAQYLFLQRLAYSGKAVGVSDGRWSSPGFNTSSAYGLPGTDRFGQVNPMIPSLVRVLHAYADVVRPERLGGGHRPAPEPAGRVAEPTAVYLDPPYVGSTAYPNGSLDRPGVVALACAWREAGAAVMVSEGEPVAELVALGWRAIRLTARRHDSAPFRGKQEEWLTLAGA